MYHYFEIKRGDKNSFVLKSRSLMRRLEKAINKENYLQVTIELVGSGSRKMVTQNENEPIDLDFNLYINEFKHLNSKQIKEIKDYVKTKYDPILQKDYFKWGYSHDSTSALSTDLINIANIDVKFKIDLAILMVGDNGNLNRLIHDKSLTFNGNHYMWNEVFDSKDIYKKGRELKQIPELWIKLKEVYLSKKNMYLTRQQEKNHPSFNVYIESVNEIYNANKSLINSNTSN